MYHAMMTLPDGMNYWKYATEQTKNTNAMELATVFNNIFHLDSVNVSVERRGNIPAIAIGMFKEEAYNISVRPRMRNWQECITWLMTERNRHSRL